MTTSAQPAAEPSYPEHAKLKAIKDQSEAQGEFLTWLQEGGFQGKRITLMTWVEGDFEEVCDGPMMAECDGGTVTTVYGKTERCPLCKGTGRRMVHRAEWQMIHMPIEKLLAAFHGVDLDTLEREKVAMLDYIRNHRG